MGSSFCHATGRDWARFGQMYLDDGVAPNGQRVLPEGWVEYTTTPGPASLIGTSFPQHSAYGAQMWLNRPFSARWAVCGLRYVAMVVQQCSHSVIFRHSCASVLAVPPTARR